MRNKKMIILLLIFAIMLTGCSIKTLDDNDLGSNVKYILSKKNNIYNVYFDGYKYYVPKGINFIEKEEYNALLRDKYDNKYYLYVDAISYYNKTSIKYKVNNNCHYSKKIKENGKEGYLQIDEVNGKFFVQYVYNFSKIESLVSKESLVDSVTNMSFILRSVKFNDTVLESLIGNNILSYKEENYSLFNKETSSETFLDVVEKYEKDAYKEALQEEESDLED